MLESEDLYESLQVHPSAHPEVIEAAHRALAELYGPGRNSYPNARKMLDAIGHAHDVLTNPVRRAQYDQYRKDRSQVPEVVRSKSFQVLDDDGSVRAELGCRVLSQGDSSDTQPVLELKDPVGHVRFSVSLNYFDRPRLVMADEEEDDERFVVALANNGETLLLMRDEGDRESFEVSGGNLMMRDAQGVIRFQAGLSGGDEGDSPRLVMRDKFGRTRLEIELVEVELDRTVAQVGDDYELSPLTFAFPPRLKMRDEEGNIRLEAGLFGTDLADSPMLRVLDDKENPRLEIGYRDDSPWVVMKDKDGADRLEVELAEVEINGGHDYIPQLRVRDENEDILFEKDLPGS